ncbi:MULTISPECIES: hypothetical protein [Rhizobium]|uniref:Uncharacterized protein n=1 Tax=Rhizobium paranaense TaxID=1650438 RepID=A0A7W9D1L5_9HYPH|nr:hypothetical protein [Rhizobium paranaense]MBB5574323.1 hypothetical protein [Rhizobium paranaense]
MDRSLQLLLPLSTVQSPEALMPSMISAGRGACRGTLRIRPRFFSIITWAEFGQKPSALGAETFLLLKATGLLRIFAWGFS